MTWKEFQKLSREMRARLLMRPLMEQVEVTVKQFHRDCLPLDAPQPNPNVSTGYKEVRELLLVLLQFRVLDDAPATIRWARESLSGSFPGDFPNNKGELLAALIKRWGPLAWGWRSRNNVMHRGLIQIVHEDWDRLDPMDIFLAHENLPNFTLKDAAQAYTDWRRKQHPKEPLLGLAELVNSIDCRVRRINPPQ